MLLSSHRRAGKARSRCRHGEGASSNIDAERKCGQDSKDLTKGQLGNGPFPPQTWFATIPEKGILLFRVLKKIYL